VVVVIIGIFSTLAVPQITRQMRDRRAQQAAQQVVQFYRQARLRAMGRGGAVNVRYVPGTGGHGVLTLADAVVGGGDANTACAEMPSSSCSLPDWTNTNASDPNSTARLVATFNTGRDTGGDDVYVTMFEPGTTNTAGDIEVCFTPMGRAFVRQGQVPTGGFTPLTQVLSGRIERKVGSSGGTTVGLVREFTLLPSGGARTATRAP
jgi:type IV fimbrial biogenesis protein FimT